MHFSGHIHNTLYLQECSWAVSWAFRCPSSVQHTFLLAPSCSFSQRLLPDCVPPPQHMLSCSLMMLSQLLHSCLPHTVRAKTCLATQLPAEHMGRTNGDDQIFWSVPLAPWTVKAESTKTLPTASPLACQWVREDFSLFSYLKENFLPAAQMVGIVSLPVCFSPLQPITQNLS